MNFGITNVPSTFVTLMNSFFKLLLEKYTVMYLNNIIVFSKIEQQHEEDLNLYLISSKSTNYILNQANVTCSKEV